MASNTQVYQSIGYFIVIIIVLAFTISTAAMQMDSKLTMVVIAAFGMSLLGLLYWRGVRSAM